MFIVSVLLIVLTGCTGSQDNTTKKDGDQPNVVPVTIQIINKEKEEARFELSLLSNGKEFTEYAVLPVNMVLTSITQKKLL